MHQRPVFMLRRIILFFHICSSLETLLFIFKDFSTISNKLSVKFVHISKVMPKLYLNFPPSNMEILSKYLQYEQEMDKSI